MKDMAVVALSSGNNAAIEEIMAAERDTRKNQEVQEYRS